MMDRRGPKHVELTYVMNKTHSVENFVYLVGLHIYHHVSYFFFNLDHFIKIFFSTSTFMYRISHICVINVVYVNIYLGTIWPILQFNAFSNPICERKGNEY